MVGHGQPSGNARITVPFRRTEISRRSCIPSSIILWNALDEDITITEALGGGGGGQYPISHYFFFSKISHILQKKLGKYHQILESLVSPHFDQTIIGGLSQGNAIQEPTSPDISHK